MMVLIHLFFTWFRNAIPQNTPIKKTNSRIFSLKLWKAMVERITIPIVMKLSILYPIFPESSPIKIKSGVTDAGHALGLVYYAGIWTLLIFLLPDKLWIVGVAVGAMVYGDGFASLIGQKYGRHHFNLTGDVKSVEGSLTMFIMVCVMCSVVFLVYGAIGYDIPQYNFAFVAFISLIAFRI